MSGFKFLVRGEESLEYCSELFTPKFMEIVMGRKWAGGDFQNQITPGKMDQN